MANGAEDEPATSSYKEFSEAKTDVIPRFKKDEGTHGEAYEKAANRMFFYI